MKTETRKPIKYAQVKRPPGRSYDDWVKAEMKANRESVVWKKNVGYVNGRRADRRRSPKFPDESEWQQYVRLWCHVPDDAPVAVDLGQPMAARRSREPEQDEVYPKSPRRLPDGKGLLLVRACGGPVLRLKGTKWKEVRKWAEAMVGLHADNGRALTVSALCGLARQLELPEADLDKVVRRLKAVYADDWRREQAEAELLFNRRTESPQPAGRAEPVKVSAPNVSERPNRNGARAGAGTDAWGFRLGTRCAKINAAITDVPKTVKEIEAEVGCRAASSHVGRLFRMGVVVKIGKTYKLAEGEHGCRSSSPSGRSDAAPSTPPKRGSKSDNRGKASRRESSTANSRKGKHAGSGKRRSRRD